MYSSVLSPFFFGQIADSSIPFRNHVWCTKTKYPYRNFLVCPQAACVCVCVCNWNHARQHAGLCVCVSLQAYITYTWTYMGCTQGHMGRDFLSLMSQSANSCHEGVCTIRVCGQVMCLKHSCGWVIRTANMPVS
jgi:hypothetical protein